MHRLSHLVINNFRACRDVSLPLEGYTPLVGQNNTGKSTILEAIEWVLKPKGLTGADFYDPQSPIDVAACIDGISNEVLDRIPQDRHRAAIEPYCRDGRLWIRVRASGPAKKDFRSEIWDIEKCPHDSVPGEDQWRTYPTGISDAVSSLFPEPLVVQAMHDLGEDLGKVKAGTTIKGLLDEIMEPLLNAHAELNTALETIRGVLTAGGDHRSEHLQQFDKDATDALAHFFPGLEVDLDLQVLDLKDFFKAGDLHVTDNATGERRRFDQMGTGAQRATQMALIRYLAGTRRTDQDRSARRLLLIDEPELYLHPQAIRRLRHALANLADAGFQVVFSTHSPLMLSRENASDTINVGKTADEGVTTEKPLRHAVEQALKNESQSRALFELGNLAEIYFADQVVLCEGKTDRRLLPLAYERLFDHFPEMDHVAFLSLGSCGDIPKALPVLHAMGIRACAVADLDFAYTHARSGGLLDKQARDLAEAKDLLTRLQRNHGFILNGNGLPQNDNGTGWQASDVWALFAEDEEGQQIALRSHEALKQSGVWVWPNGSIEQVTGADRKGEEAIVEQEEQLQEMGARDVQLEMPAFKACFNWIRDLR